jgi:succinyl-CoA synthetase beta subunit/citryl-CoA synthetase large subunit
MLPLLEDQSKTWLRSRGLPVPRGAAATTAEEAETIAREMKGGCFVKALVPAGRRGKSGVVRPADNDAEAREAAAAMLGTTHAGYQVGRIYIEERIDIAQELYLSFSLVAGEIRILLSQKGGVDIEDTFAKTPGAVVSEPVDALAGLSSWRAIDLWRQAGLRGTLLQPLGEITAALFAAFRAADAHTLEINPLAVDKSQTLSLVGAMVVVDEYARFRHPEWSEAEQVIIRPANEREQRVRQANAALPGGEAQYVELDGNIGLLVGGGGAGLYIHDLIVAMGGRPANHCVTPPTSSDTRKLKVVLTAILDHPQLRGLLVGFNFAQMARADIRIEALAEVLRERGLRDAALPIVVRLFGPGEDKARGIAAAFSNIIYLPRGASLHDACKLIVEKTSDAA